MREITQRIQERSRQMTEAFHWFFKQEASSGIVLLLCAVLAMAAANSPWASAYEHVLHREFIVGIAPWQLSMTLLHWINDGLMAVFFFVIGMEIKREFLFGELQSPSSTLLPVAAALGGMVVPVLLYIVFNIGKPSINGWGVPMATDIAFSLGVLAFAAPKAPRVVVVFLTALAIVDDLGGILVIALFYSSALNAGALACGVLIAAALFAASRLGMRSVYGYLAGGVLLWYAFFYSGIHPTIAGVVLGFLIPAGTEETHEESLLYRLEHRLTAWSAYFVMPVFALSNAAIPLDGGSISAVASPVSLGIIAGLCLGKPAGIFLAVYGLKRLQVVSLPKSAGLGHFLGAGLLGGIGFTMSLFIASLAFDDVSTLTAAKTAIVAASAISGIAGTVMFAWLGRSRPAA